MYISSLTDDEAPMHTAAAYVRISQDALDLGLGVDRQRTLCTRQAESRGWTIAEFYTDNDLSASTGKPRPDYLRMCQDIRDGRRDGIVCVDQDRLVRLPRELEDVIDLGVPIALDSGSLDLTKSDDRFRARMMGAVATAESERKSERIRRQKDYARARGWWLGRPPYGYVTVDSGDGGRKLQADPDQADKVREMARRVLAGDTLHSVASWAGPGWHPLKVKRTLLRPAVAGWQPQGDEMFRHPDTRLPVNVTTGGPVLDEVTWRRLQAVFAGRKRTGVDGRSSGAFLSRLIFCAVCGHGMSYSSGGRKGQARYACRTSHERNGQCPGNGVAAGRVHELVDLYVEQRLADLDPPPADTTMLDTSEVARLTVALTSEEANRRALILDGASPERINDVQATIDVLDRTLRQERTTLERDRRKLDLGVLAATVGRGDRVAVYRSGSQTLRRQVVGLLVVRVDITPAGGRTSVFDPARVTVVPVA